MKLILVSALVALSLFSSTTAIPTSKQERSIERRWDAPPLPPCPAGEYMPFTYLGCYAQPNPETLQYNPNLNFSSMTVETCTATCKSNGFRYAGLLYYGNCLCGTMLPPVLADDSYCSDKCTGNQSEFCGGNNYLSIYEDTTYPAVDLSTIGSQYTPIGCYTDDGPYRAVTYQQTQLDYATMTIEECLTTCGNELYAFAGLEYFGQCFCGYGLEGGSTIANSNNCLTPCNGNTTEMCGGYSYISVFEATILESTQPCGYIAPPPVSSSLVLSSSTSSSFPSSTLASSSSTSPSSSSTSSQSTSTLSPSSSTSSTLSSSSSQVSSSQSQTSSSTSATAVSTAPATCGTGTAYGYTTTSGDVDTTFISLGIGSNWGWVLSGTNLPMSGTLYMGAGQNDIAKATNVGSFSIAHVGSNIVLTYTLTSGYFLSAAHFYYGATYPKRIAPGQFGNTHDPLALTTTDTFTVPYVADQNTYIVHAGISVGC